VTSYQRSPRQCAASDNQPDRGRSSRGAWKGWRCVRFARHPAALEHDAKLCHAKATLFKRDPRFEEVRAGDHRDSQHADDGGDIDRELTPPPLTSNATLPLRDGARDIPRCRQPDNIFMPQRARNKPFQPHGRRSAGARYGRRLWDASSNNLLPQTRGTDGGPHRGCRRYGWRPAEIAEFVDQIKRRVWQWTCAAPDRFDRAASTRFGVRRQWYATSVLAAASDQATAETPGMPRRLSR